MLSPETINRKIKLVLRTAETANSEWVKNYWSGVANELVNKYPSMCRESLVEKNNELQKKRMLN